MEETWIGQLAQAVFSEAGLVALLLFAGLVYMAYREAGTNRRNTLLQDKLIELTVMTNATLDKHAMLLDAIKDRMELSSR
jgi:hypothetical protein